MGNERREKSEEEREMLQAEAGNLQLTNTLTLKEEKNKQRRKKNELKRA